ncbi:MAG: HD domain-containing protein [Bacillota bacterium]
MNYPKMDTATCNHLFELARPYLTVRSNQEHTEICFLFAGELQENLGGRKEIIFPAIILHDVGWSAVPEELHLQAFGPKVTDQSLNRIHEIEGAKIAAMLLQKISLSTAAREEICRIIENHDSGKNPRTLEEKIVKDADKLFRFSPRGFPIDVQRFNVDAGIYWHKLNEFKEQWFFTALGKKIAARELQKVGQQVFK